MIWRPGCIRMSLKSIRSEKSSGWRGGRRSSEENSGVCNPARSSWCSENATATLSRSGSFPFLRNLAKDWHLLVVIRGLEVQIGYIRRLLCHKVVLRRILSEHGMGTMKIQVQDGGHPTVLRMYILPSSFPYSPISSTTWDSRLIS